MQTTKQNKTMAKQQKRYPFLVEEQYTHPRKGGFVQKELQITDIMCKLYPYAAKPKRMKYAQYEHMMCNFAFYYSHRANIWDWVPKYTFFADDRCLLYHEVENDEGEYLPYERFEVCLKKIKKWNVSTMCEVEAGVEIFNNFRKLMISYRQEYRQGNVSEFKRIHLSVPPIFLKYYRMLLNYLCGRQGGEKQKYTDEFEYSTILKIVTVFMVPLCKCADCSNRKDLPRGPMYCKQWNQECVTFDCNCIIHLIMRREMEINRQFWVIAPTSNFYKTKWQLDTTTPPPICYKEKKLSWNSGEHSLKFNFDAMAQQLQEEMDGTWPGDRPVYYRQQVGGLEQQVKIKTSLDKDSKDFVETHITELEQFVSAMVLRVEESAGKGLENLKKTIAETVGAFSNKKIATSINVGMGNHWCLAFGQIGLLIANLYQAKTLSHATTILLSFFSQFKVAVNISMSFIEQFSRLFSAVTPQSATESTFFQKCVKLFFQFVNLITFNKMPSAKETFSFLRNINIIERGVVSAVKLAEYVQKTVRFIFVWLYERITGTRWDQKMEEVEEWMKNVSAINVETMSKPDIDVVINEVVDLLTKGWEFDKLFRGTSLHNEFAAKFAYLKTLHLKLQNIQAETEYTVPPFCLYLYGASGLGKSTITRQLISEFIAADPNIKTDEERITMLTDQDKYIFHRKVENEFHDGLKYHHFITVYDDIFQQVDVAGVPNLELMELIRLIGTAPVVPHMADVNMKGRFMMRHRLIVCTSNHPGPRPIESISEPEAIKRRIGQFKIKVVGKPDHSVPLKFVRVDPDDQPLTGEMDYQEFKQLYRQEIVAWFQQQNKRKDESDQYQRNLIEEIVKRNKELSPELTKLKQLGNTTTTKAEVYQSQIGSEEEIVSQVLEDEQTDLKFFQDFAEYIVERQIAEEELEETLNKCKMEESRTFFRLMIARIANRSRRDWNDVKVYSATVCNRVRVKIDIVSSNLYRTFQEHRNATFLNKLQHFMREAHHKVRTFFFNDGKQEVWNILKWVSVAVVSGLGLYNFGWIREKVTDFMSNMYHKFKTSTLKEGKNWNLDPEKVTFIYIVGFNKWFWYLKKSYAKAAGLPMVLHAVDDYMDFDFNTFENFQQEGKMDGSALKDVQLKIAYNLKELQKIYKGVDLVQEGARYPEGLNKKQGKKISKLPFHAKQEAVSDESYLPARSSVQKNLWNITTSVPMKKEVAVGAMVGVKGKIFLSFGHLIPYLSRHKTFTISKGVTRITVPVEQVQVCALLNDSCQNQMIPGLMSVLEYTNWQEMNRADARDAVLMYIPITAIPIQPDIVKHVISFADMDRVDGSTFELLNVVADTRELCVCDAKLSRKEIENEGEESVFSIAENYTYKATTRPGSCGSPLFVINQNIAGKWCGLHVAGRMGSCVGVASCIYKELIQAALGRFIFEAQIGRTQGEPFEESSVELPEGMYLIGKTNNPVYTPSKSKIVHSSIYSLAFEPKMERMHLKPYIDEDGRQRNPLWEGIQKYAGIRPDMDKEELRQIAESIFDHIHNVSPYPKLYLRRTFNIMEAVFGITGEKHFGALNRTTSPGRNWDRRQQKGKTYYIRGELGSKTEPPFIHQELVQAVEYRIGLAKENIRLDVIYQDTLKDERKKKGGKTRIFSNGPMDYAIACRMYFGGFATWFLSNNVFNTSLVGINMYDDKVDYMARMFNLHPNIIAGDFKNYDGDERADILWALLVFIEKFYTDSTLEERRVRYILFVDLINSIHIADDIVYELVKSIPSGHPLTSIINTLYNLFLNVIAYLRIAPKHLCSIKHYFEYVFSFYFGDDHIIGCANQIKKFFTYAALRDAYKELGHTYTSCMKDEITDKKPFDKLSEVTILKRYIQYDNLERRYIARLSKDVIEEMVNWVKKTEPRDKATLDNIELSLREASLWDEQYYNYVYTQVTRALQEARLTIIPKEPYSILRKQVLAEELIME